MKGATRLRSWLPALLLAALTAAAFAPVARNGFVNYDDETYIYENPQVLRGLNAETALWALTTTEHGNWYPLRRLSHLADVSLFGLWAGGHHLVSLGWHAAAALLLFAALRLMTGSPWRGFLVAALFAVHPLQVESVAWAAERSNVQAGFFFALTLLLWARYARRPGAGRYAAALAAGALGLAAKPTLMPLPLVLLLADFWPLGRMGGPGGAAPGGALALARRRLAEQAPLLLLAAGSGAGARRAHRQAGAAGLLLSYPLGVRLGNAALSAVRYLGSLLRPSDLAVFYPHPGLALAAGRAAAAGALLAVLTGLALAGARRRPWLVVGWLGYLGLLAPTIGIVPFGPMARADRFAYLAVAGIALALVWSAAEDLPPGRLRRAGGGIAAALLAALAAATFAQARLWRDDLTLFPHAIAATSRNWSAELNLALALDKAGRREEAVEHYRRGLRDFPYDRSVVAPLVLKLGNGLFALRRYEEAAAAYRDAAAAAPREAAAFYNLGNALAESGRHGEAAAAYREAVRLKPDHARALNNLAGALFALGRYPEAAAAAGEAVRLAPGDPVARNNLARALRQIGRPDAP